MEAHRHVEVRVNVEQETGLSGATVAATVWLPPSPAERQVVCFAFPGGGFSRGYFSFDVPGRDGDGEAGYHLDRGWVVVTVDPLGVGGSTVPDRPVSLELIAAANAALVRDVLRRLADRSIEVGFAPLKDVTSLGVGQSMGAHFVLVLQAHHRTFDGIGVLGSSAIHTVVPSRPGTAPIPFPWLARSTPVGSPVLLNADRLQDVTAAPDGPAPGADDENPFRWAFHFDDEPPDLVAADMAAEPLPPWRSATTPDCAILGVSPGVVATEAAAITVPVFVGVGERDVVPNPWLEPFAYRSSTDVTLFVCKGMAHMHNFATTRERLWRRLHHWGDGVAAAEQGATSR